MTAREKAIELINKFENPSQGVILFKELRKALALIAVDEIIDAIANVYEHDWNVLYPYWTEVKQEIINL